MMTGGEYAMSTAPVALCIEFADGASEEAESNKEWLSDRNQSAGDEPERDTGNGD